MVDSIAFFDFDGTITQKDTLFEFIKYTRGRLSFYTGILRNMPYLLAYKFNLISNQRAKERLLITFFKNTDKVVFEKWCHSFCSIILPAIIRPAALSEITKLQNKNFKVVIVSASAEDWIIEWANKYNIDVIATKLEVANNKLTGKISGLNCNGEQKVKRIREQFNLSNYKEIYAYGDSKGDYPMLALATFSKLNPFKD